MPSSTQAPKFLLDENVRQELLPYLKNIGVDVRRVPVGSTDAAIAALSLKEKRILVTNDVDFSDYKKDAIEGVIWLRVA